MENIVAPLAEILISRRLTLVTAESCTGGLVGSWLTDWPGSSRFYLGGIQAYANSVKISMLGVPDTILESEGAVSEACAAAMAEGVRRRFGADYAISTTGIAGPGGGTPEKPVGLVYCGIAGSNGSEVSRNVWTGSRFENKQASAQAAIELLAQHLMNHGDF
ncbi:MAG: CinA family protein [Verrucomicrobiota bacterium]